MNILIAQMSEEHLLKWKGQMDRGRRQHPPRMLHMGGWEDICIANESDSVEMEETVR